MLILPLHRPITRKTFPFVTAFLVLANVLVFALFQTGDEARMQALRDYYLTSPLPALEWPLYLDYLRAHPDAGEEGNEDRERALKAAAAREPDPLEAHMLLSARLSDPDVERWLDTRGPLVGVRPGETSLADLQRQFRRRLARIVTDRYALRYSNVAPARLFGYMFLHGSWMHLIGNMVFLVALGLLVEGAVGELRYLLLYLLGGLGAAAAMLWMHWGEPGGAVGASGAISGLMGAFCVIWGRRPVRFFWWFFVAFDYIRKPAIWLLPAWIGWQLFMYIRDRYSGVAYDAHLGGLVIGALLGWLLVAAGQLREEFLADPEEGSNFAERLARARAHLGRMELPAAEQLLAAEQPGNFEVLALAQRAAVLAGNQGIARSRSLQLLQLVAADRAQAEAQFAALEQSFAGLELPAGAWHASLRSRWMALRCHDQVAALLERWLAREPDAPTAWLELARAERDAGRAAQARKALENIVARYAKSPEAAKARFLLEHEARA